MRDGENAFERTVAVKQMRVSFEVAGTMSLRSDAGSVEDEQFAGRQQRLTAAMLLLERSDPIAIDRIADELWDGAPPNSWRSALRTLVAQVRGLLAGVGVDGGSIVFRAGRYHVDLPGLWVDVEAAVRDVDQGLWHLDRAQPDQAQVPLQAAVDVLDRPVMPGVAGAWLQRLRDSLELRRIDALVASAECERRLGRSSAARRAAQRAVAAAPLREDAWRALMLVEADAGNTAEALDAYRRCREHLATSLGTDPDTQTQHLHAQLLRGRLPRRSSGHSRRPSTGGGPLAPHAAAPGRQLVGRDDELDTVVQCLLGGISLLVQGPSGIGKTRLVTEALATASLRKRPTDRLMGSPGTAQVRLSTLAPIGPGSEATTGPVSSVYQHFLSRWRQGDPAGQPMLVWIDDVQHVDSLSAAILRHARVSGSVQLVVTHRTSEPLGEDMRSLVREGLLERIELAPLTREASAELANQVAGIPIPTDELRRLVDLADGNPLYIRELAASIDPRDRVLHLDRSDELLARPLQGLPESVRRAAELIALAEPVSASLFSTRSDDVAELSARALVRPHGQGDLRTDHPLRGAWLVENLGSTVSEAYAELVALARHAEGIDPVSIVDWTLRADLSPPPALARQAARLAILRSDGDTALRIAAHVEGTEGDLLRAQATVLSGSIEAGLEQLEQVRGDGDARERVEAASWLARFVGVMQGDYARAHALLSDTDGEDLAPQLRRHLLLARLWLWIFGPISDEEPLRHVEELAQAPPFDPSVHDVLTGALNVGYLRGSPAQHEDLYRWLSQVQEEEEIGPDGRARGNITMCGFWLFAGKVDRAANDAVAHVTEALQAGGPEAITLTAGLGGWITALNGRLETARRIGMDAMATYTEVDWFNYRLLARLVFLGNRVYLGAAPEVDGPIDELSPSTASHHDLPHLLYQRARALADEALGREIDWDHAGLRFNRMIVSGKPSWVLPLAAELTDRRTPAALHELVFEAAASISGPGLARPVAAASRARLDGDLTSLVDAGLEYERMGMVPAAMRCFGDAVAQVSPDDSIGRSARAGIVRGWRAWDGPEPVWTRDLPGLPPHDLAVRVPHSSGPTPEHAADHELRARVATALDLDVEGLDMALQPRTDP